MKNNVKSSFLKAKMFMRFKMSDRKKVPIIALVTFVRLIIYKNFSDISLWSTILDMIQPPISE